MKRERESERVLAKKYRLETAVRSLALLRASRSNLSVGSRE